MTRKRRNKDKMFITVHNSITVKENKKWILAKGTWCELCPVQSEGTFEPFLSRDLHGTRLAVLLDHSRIKMHTQDKSVNTSLIYMGRFTVISSDRKSPQDTFQQWQLPQCLKNLVGFITEPLEMLESCSGGARIVSILLEFHFF